MKHQLHSVPLLATLLSTALSLAACGGGGNNEDPPPASPEGAYSGTLTGSASAQFQLFVLENNEFWAFYGANNASGFRVAGFMQGSGTASGSSFNAPDVRDFGFSPARSATMGASYNAPAGTVGGSVNSSGALISFSGNRIPAATFNHDTPATLAQIAGTWSLQPAGAWSLQPGVPASETVALTVGANGSFTGSTSLACGFTGTVAPRASGKNVFNVSVSFGAAPCALPGQTATGIALIAPLANGGRQLIVAGMNAQRTQGIAAFGSRL